LALIIILRRTDGFTRHGLVSADVDDRHVGWMQSIYSNTTHQTISELSPVAPLGAVVPSGAIAQSGPIAQSGAVAQSGAIATCQ
jgi:hypothetical protein